MMIKQRIALVASLAAGLALAGTASQAAEKTEKAGKSAMGVEHKDVKSLSAQKVIENWPEASKTAAMAIIQKYGQPDMASNMALVWNDNGSWKKTVVLKDEVDHLFPVKHKDVLLQTINYRVPVEQFDDLAQFDGSLIIDRTKGELSARCDKEDHNFLALNLANDIVTGKRTVEEARRFMADTVAGSMAGRTSEYTQKLLFPVANSGTADPGETLLKEGGVTPTQGAQPGQEPQTLPGQVPQQPTQPQTPEVPGPERGY